MSTDQAPPAPPPAEPPPAEPPPAEPPAAEPPPETRVLRRTRDQRVIAGVCGGLARYTGVDPVIFRVVLAVLVLFGGVGAILYIAGWLFLPEDGDTASPVEALFGRGHSSTSGPTTVLLGVLGVVALGLGWDGQHAVLLAVALVAVVLLARRPQQRPPGSAAVASEPPPGVESAPTIPYAPHGPYPPYTAPPAPRPPRERSRLGRIVLSVAVVVVGILAAVDQFRGVSIPAAGYLATALAIVGAGLVVGSWVGRARWLIAPAAILTVAVWIASTAPHWDHHGSARADRTWRPATASAIQPTYELGAGDATLDLTSVDFSDASVQTRVHLGAGDVTVRVPADVDVTVNGRVGVGSLRLFGHEDTGPGQRRTVTDLGADGAGGGTLRLSVDSGLGTVEVTRD